MLLDLEGIFEKKKKYITNKLIKNLNAKMAPKRKKKAEIVEKKESVEPPQSVSSLIS